jgi:NADPH:quinone reductase-like Zn-dependent oxidoreductase
MTTFTPCRCRTRSCAMSTCWLRSTPRASIRWTPRSGTARVKPILPYRLPVILGNDLAGVVVRVGPEVRRFKPGDQVYARPDQHRIGTFAELISIKQDDVALKPTRLTMQQAAALPLVALTAWQALIERADLKPGQKVLIHAGSGGLGSVAIQLAKHLGATVATTTSTANVDWVEALGADLVIDYRTSDFAAVLHDYDAVFDTRGGDTLNKSFGVLKRGGKLISVAGPPDPAFAKQAGLNPILRQAIRLLSYPTRRTAKRHGVRYSFLWMQANGNQLTEIASLADSGIIRPVIDRVFPFESTKEALAYADQGRAKGKVIITMR